MKAFILAAGEGTRMRPLTANIPKPLLPVAGRPFLQHVLEALKGNGISDVLILIGWRGKRIKERFGKGIDGMNIEYIEQKQRLGTAHAISMAKEHMDSDFLCVNGDVVISQQSIRGLLKFYEKHRDTILTLVNVPNPWDFGVVELDDENVVRITEKPSKPKTNLINAGMYIFTQEIFDVIEKTEKSPRGEYEITDSIQMLIDKNKVYGHVLKEEWVDVGKPWDLLSANEILLRNLEEKIEGNVQPHATMVGNVQIGKGSEIKNGAYIVGPVIIGDNCEIGPNCLIRPSTYIGDDCKIGNAVEVKNSIIMEHSKIPHQSYVGDSIIGERCNLGAGTKTANLRLDEKNIHIYLNGKAIDTGRKKLGMIMGDDVKTGINSSIDVGTIIGEGTFIGPGAIVSGVIAPKSKLY